MAFLTVECDKRMPADQGILVSTDWLQNQLNDPNFIILHAGTEEGYDSIHIPGARLILPGDFTVSNDSTRNELPAMDSLVNLLRKAGINSDSRIVLCYENDRLISRTARVFVTLAHAGLTDRTFVLNGGLPVWLEEERETSDLAADISPGNLEAVAPVKVIIKASDLERERWSPDVVVIDTRSEKEYHGTPATREEAAEGGHIEGAYFLPYQTSFSEDKSYLFKSDAELEKTFRDSGMDRDRTTVVYCGSGIRASVSFLAASHLGYPVLLYDGSYQEWDRLNLPLTGPVDLPAENE
ncbi:MAG: sulfurtransferase [Bacteroidales bacterium]|nr:sulfurtransferase [Bacteroidales bacterium]